MTEPSETPREPRREGTDELTDLVKRNGGQLSKAALPAIGAAVIAAFFIARARRKGNAKGD